MNFTCPNCGLEDAYFELVDEKGAHYTCPNCDFEWIDNSVTSSDDEEEEEEEDNILPQTASYTHEAIGDFLRELIRNFESYGFSEEGLVVLARLYLLVRKPNKYSATGYLYVMVKEIISEGNHLFLEIQVDADGLHLTSGGYETGSYGGDSFSDTVFPVYDEMEAADIVMRVEDFIEDFKRKLTDPDIQVEIFDSGDDIEEDE